MNREALFSSMKTNTREFVNEQYKDSSKLETRINIHELYSTNQQDWHDWVFRHFAFPANARVVEFGCGSGALWQKNIAKLDESLQVLITDYSAGMLAKAKRSIGDHPSFSFRAMDIQQIEMENNSVDVAIANHMLYHVPNIKQALSEIGRILKPTGMFYASTNGLAHLKEIYEYAAGFDASLPFSKPSNARHFGLETGVEQLNEYFDEVRLIRFDCHLEIPHAEALADFIFSIGSSLKQELLERQLLDTFMQYLDDKKDGRGLIKVTKDAGLFICQNPKKIKSGRQQQAK